MRFFLWFLVAFLAISTPALAAPQCGPTANVLNVLGKKYKERPRAMGLVKDDAMMQIFVAESGTWSVVMTVPSGLSCIIAAGDHYDTVPIDSNDTPS